MEKDETAKNFIEIEHDILDFWEKNKCFETLRAKNKEGKIFRFLDGPITANNPMGIHHAWGRTIKDLFIRYKAMKGFSCHYRNGFDTQGLWVEVEVEKELGFKNKQDIEEYGMEKFTQKCIERITKYSQIISEQSKRLGQWMDWSNSYFTHADNNITGIWTFLKKCHQNGWITQSYRPMLWCPRCGTSLSEHEMTGSYRDIEHRAIFFQLPLVEKNANILVWTTTPWTLSSNIALAVNPEIEYVEVALKNDDEPLILAKKALGVLGENKSKVIRSFQGSELVGLHYETCFPDLPALNNIEHKIIPWEAVDPEEGSGVVHIAPGCGVEDFELGKQYNLPAINPVDENGVFIEGFSWLTGRKAQEVVELVLEKLDESGKLYHSHMYKHSYPVCWRCKSEVIFRLVKEWYIKTDEIRPLLLNAANSIKWEPEYIGKRMLDWLTNMGDWNISRKRFYGLPLPFYPCNECGELTVIGSKVELRSLGGDEVDNLPELHRPWVDKIKIKCPKCGNLVSRITEVGDVWLDAGIVPFSTLGYFEDKEKWSKYFPAEWVTEMREQVRLWFYSLLFMSVTLENRVPYERVLSYSSVVAEDGTMFSKTGFMIRFADAAEKIGVDAIRYLFAGANIANDVRFGYKLGDEARRKLLFFWNIYMFFNTYATLDIPNIKDYFPKKDMLTVTDRWLITRTNEFLKTVTSFYDAYQSSSVVKEFESFLDDVSNWYIRVNRRRFWKTEDDGDKNTAFWCLFQTLRTMILTMAPIIPFMSEYMWQNAVRSLDSNEPISVHLSDWPKPCPEFDEQELLERTNMLRQLIALALRLRNEKQIRVRQPLLFMYVVANPHLQKAIEEMNNIIVSELNVKQIKYIDNPNELNEAYLALNFKAAGSVLKKDAQAVKGLLLETNSIEMARTVKQFEAGERITIPGWPEALSPELFVKETRPKEGIILGVEGNITVALDTQLTEDLIVEGVMRDIIHHCQVFRKEADLKVEQRIKLGLYTESKLLKSAIDAFKDYIKEETLAESLTERIDNAILKKRIKIAEQDIDISLEPK